jgi:hypothetical protein
MQSEKQPDDLTLTELKQTFEGLTNNAAWRRLMLAIQAQVDSLQSEIIFSEVSSEADVYRLERRKGMLEGRLSLQNTFAGMLDSIQQDIRNKTGEES